MREQDYLLIVIIALSVYILSIILKAIFIQREIRLIELDKTSVLELQSILFGMALTLLVPFVFWINILSHKRNDRKLRKIQAEESFKRYIDNLTKDVK